MKPLAALALALACGVMLPGCDRLKQPWHPPVPQTASSAPEQAPKAPLSDAPVKRF